MHTPIDALDRIILGVVVLAIPVGGIAFLLYRVLRRGYAIAPWQTDVDKRFGSKNFEPPIELKLGDTCKDDVAEQSTFNVGDKEI